MSAIRKLMPFERDKYRDHLLRLGRADRRLRFGAFADNTRILAFLDSEDFGRATVLAQFGSDLQVVAAVHVSILPGRAVELAFTVDCAYRRRGIATELMTRALLWARNRGFARAHVNCLAENVAMRRVARNAGMKITSAAGDVEFTRALFPASPLSYMAEAYGESVALLDYAAKTRSLAPAGLSSLAVAEGSVVPTPMA